VDTTTHNPVEHSASQTISFFKVSLFLLVISGILLSFNRTVVDPDLWGHLRFGLDTLNNGYLTRQDPYAYTTAGQVWINHEWLAEVIFALAWRAGGNLGLILLKVFVEILTLALAFVYLRYRGIEPFRSAVYVLLFLPIMLPSIGTVRPQIFTNLFFATLLLIILMAEYGHYGWLWAAPPVVCFWTNTHGGFLAGIAILIIWSTAHLLLQPRIWKRVVIPVGITLLAVLINPYGFRLLWFLLQTAVGTRPEISEWMPIQIQSVVGVLYLIGLILCIAGLVYGNKPKRWPLLAVFAVLAPLPLLAIRHLPLYALGAIMLNGEHLDGLRTRFNKPSKGKKPLPEWLGFLHLACIGLIWIQAAPQFNQLLVKSDNADFTSPIQSVQLIKQSGVTGNLMIDFNWGEYAIWQLAPRVKVGMDGRRETVYPEQMYAEYINFYFGIKEWDAVLKEYPSDMVLMSSKSAPVNLLKLKADWQVVYADQLSTLFVRRDSPVAQQLLNAARDFQPPPGEKQFP
jgi:hypothetical protein